MKENKCEKYYGVVFNRRSGKIIRIMEENFDDAFLKFYAMGNLTKANDYVVFGDDGIITGYYEGKGKSDFPNICHDMEGKHTREICEGLLEAVTE